MEGQIPKTMKALTVNLCLGTRIFNFATNKTWADGALIKDVPVPSIKDNELLVKVTMVALNPTDFKHMDFVGPRGAVLGCDFAGKIVKVGRNAPGDWKVGDRIAGAVHGGLYPDRGSFAEYLKIPGEFPIKIPDYLSDQEAATIGVSAVSAMLALNKNLDVPWVDGGKTEGRRDTPILIYSASTSAGLYAIQLAKLAGLTVVATASAQSFDIVKEYGADAVFDYRSPTAVDEIIRAYPNIDRAMDCFSEGKSTQFCINVIKKNGGKVVTLLDTGKSHTPGVETVFIVGYTVFNLPFQWVAPFGPKFDALPSAHQALIRFYGSFPELLPKLKTMPIKPIDGGLENIKPGLDLLRKGQVARTKLMMDL
jgi:NADPH:quinone reductase-like Zn-dependent oxidoreductase